MNTLFEMFDEPETPVGVAEDITLRPYQRDAVDAVFDRWQTDSSTLVVCPTGTGKSVIFSEVMRRYCNQ